MDGADGSLSLCLAVALSQFCHHGIWDRSGCKSATKIKTVLGLGSSQPLVERAKQTAKALQGEGACIVITFLDLLMEALGAVRLEYPLLHCPCCGVEGKLKVKRLRRIGVLTA